MIINILKTRTSGTLFQQTLRYLSNVKRHSERKLIKYKCEHIYDVVADVASYKHFIPWCQDSIIIEANENYLKAELNVGFNIFNETYVSEVTMKRPNLIIAVSTDTKLLKYLKTEWKFTPASNDSNACWVTFQIEFQFKSSLYNHISDLFFDEVVKNMTNAFESRCMKTAPNT
jgi:ribosome-associated toxin RatA of RatAB toxin-antitoxin module